MLEFGPLLDPAALGAAAGASSPTGLALVEEEIDAVITTLNDELDAIQETDFEVKAHIGKASFGAGEEAVALAGHHTRAHGVVVDTLTELIADLRTFRESVREARRLVRKSDEDAESRLLLVLDRTEQLDLGRYAHVEAQNNHRHDVPTDEPAGEPGAATGGEDS